MKSESKANKKMDALGRPFRVLCKMCGNAVMKSYSILP